MAEIWKPQPIEVYQQWVRDILHESSNLLNDWETNFIDSIDNQLTGGRNLTENQATKLENIYTDKTS